MRCVKVPADFWSLLNVQKNEQIRCKQMEKLFFQLGIHVIFLPFLLWKVPTCNSISNYLVVPQSLSSNFCCCKLHSYEILQKCESPFRKINAITKSPSLYLFSTNHNSNCFFDEIMKRQTTRFLSAMLHLIALVVKCLYLSYLAFLTLEFYQDQISPKKIHFKQKEH